MFPGYLSGGPHNKDSSFSGVYIGVPNFGKLPISCGRRSCREVVKASRKDAGPLQLDNSFTLVPFLAAQDMCIKDTVECDHPHFERIRRGWHIDGRLPWVKV